MEYRELMSAFREVASSEFINIPVDEKMISLDFSREFNEKMNRLIKKEKKLYWNLISTTSKKIACIIVALTVMFTATLSVNAVREPIVTFFKEVQEVFVEYFFKGNVSNEISRNYSITKLPEEFTLVEKKEDPFMNVTEYRNSKNSIITLVQNPTNSERPCFDSENSKLVEFSLPNIDVDLYISEGVSNAIWICNGYYFTLTCYGDFSVENIKEIIESIE